MSNTFWILAGKWVTRYARLLNEGQRLQPHKLRSSRGDVMSEDDSSLPVTLRESSKKRRPGRHMTT